MKSQTTWSGLVVCAALALGACGGGGGGSGGSSGTGGSTPGFQSFSSDVKPGGSLTLNGISQSGTRTYRSDASGGYYEYGSSGDAKSVASITLGYDTDKAINALRLTSAEGTTLAWNKAAASPDTIEAATLGGSAPTVSTTKLTSSDGKKTAYMASNTDWDYQTFGFWDAPGTPTAQGSYGGFSVGAATAGVNIPTRGSATYTGEIIGKYTDGSLVVATVSVTVNFADNGASANFTITNSRLLSHGSWIDQSSNFNLTARDLKYQAQTNQITGDISAPNGTGRISARFYGPNAEQIGGTFFTTVIGGAYFGSFGGKRAEVATTFTNFTDVASSNVRISGDSQTGTATFFTTGDSSNGLRANGPSTPASGATVVLGYDSQSQMNLASITPAGSDTPIAWKQASGDSFRAATVGSVAVTEITAASDATKILRLIKDPSWNYQTLGIWGIGLGNQAGSYGSISVGLAAPAASIPTSGTATYRGYTIGRALGINVYSRTWTASMTVTVDFSKSTNQLSFTTTGTSGFVDTNRNNLLSPSELDLNGTLTYLPATNQFTGTVKSRDFSRSGIQGTVTGRFYGPSSDSNALEMGGTFYLVGSSFWYIGSFGGKKQ